MAGFFPFDPSVEKHKWVSIKANGFPKPVPGCVYEGTRLKGGIPLGGLGTGYFTLEGSGKIGRCSIYNDIVPPREDFKEWLIIREGNTHLPLSAAEIIYWGHFPIADMVARFSEKPITLGIRAFSPFVLGDSSASNIPCALFEIEVVNPRSETLNVELIITPPALLFKEAHLKFRKDYYQMHLCGEGLNVNYENSNEAKSIHGILPITLVPNGSKHIRFVFSWFAPNWGDTGGEPHLQHYSVLYKNAKEVAEKSFARFDELLNNVLAWQKKIYYAADLPIWLKDALVQSFYSYAKNSIWIAHTRKDEWWDKNGWFTHSESHTGCPITETIVCRIHGHFPTLFFFPELEETTLNAFRHFQISDGEIPFAFGTGTAMRDPRYHCQHPLNSGEYAQMVYQLYLRTGDKDKLCHFYPSAKKAIQYQFSLDDDGDGLVNDQPHLNTPTDTWPANQFYDQWPWFGTSGYVAGIWLATLSVGEAIASIVKDTEFANECRKWLIRGKKAYEEKLWTGKYFRLWNNSLSNRKCDVSLANQLMGEWCVKVVGLPSIFSEEHIQSALDTIERLNMKATEYGLVNGVTPEGKPFISYPGIESDFSRQIFVGENLCAAVTYLYHNRKDVGLEIARRIYEAVAIKSLSTWNQNCLISAESGLPIWGDSYYSNMVIWAIPMALVGKGIREFAKNWEK